MRYLLILLTTLIPASAQWIHYPTPGIPPNAGRKTGPFGPGAEDRGR
jgi:hypothetical protein